MEKQGQKYCKIYLFQEKKTIENIDDLRNRANYLRETINGYIKENRKKIHLFPDTTAPLMFAMAAKTIVRGKIQLYEYINEENSYYKSLVR
ncbi:MAG: hypothetical protein HFH68_04600 [Lachnospiraceae bacterium]|nr:hypothetical protein [Lachnospiraceae bacterium]